jgi:signal transduction histidine kinase
MAASAQGDHIHIISEIFQENGARHIALSVVDSGCGIPEDKMQEIFRPFYTTRKDGTGLGLTITKRIAEENKWQLHIKSHVNKGTKVSLTIPLNGNHHETK